MWKTQRKRIQIEKSGQQYTNLAHFSVQLNCPHARKPYFIVVDYHALEGLTLVHFAIASSTDFVDYHALEGLLYFI